MGDADRSDISRGSINIGSLLLISYGSILEIQQIISEDVSTVLGLMVSKLGKRLRTYITHEICNCFLILFVTRNTVIVAHCMSVLSPGTDRSDIFRGSINLGSLFLISYGSIPEIQ